LQHIFEILLDDEKRRIYDETGLDPDSDDACFGHLSPEDILRFCRRHLGQVTEERIVEFERKYRGSNEEQQDLKQFYVRFQGDLHRILHYIICSDESDIPRFIRFYDDCISKGELTSTKAYQQSKKTSMRRFSSVKKKERVLSHDDKDQPTANNENNNSLTQLVLSNQKKRMAAMDAFCDAILNKATAGANQKSPKQPRRLPKANRSSQKDTK